MKGEEGKDASKYVKINNNHSRCGGRQKLRLEDFIPISSNNI
jgi:hypothetical protein